MSNHLFAYGTLQPGLAPPEITALVSRLKPISEGFVRGLLYDLGGYCGAVLDPSSQHTIAGTIFELPNDPQFLRELDAYEEYDPAAPETSLYKRVLCPVALTKSGTLQCWIYTWNGDPATSPTIPGGRFRKTTSSGLSE